MLQIWLLHTPGLNLEMVLVPAHFHDSYKKQGQQKYLVSSDIANEFIKSVCVRHFLFDFLFFLDQLSLLLLR